MIIDLLLAIVNALVGWLVTLLPEWGMELPGGIAEAFTLMLGLNDFLPITEILVSTGLICTLFGGMILIKWAIKLIDWIADVIP